MIQVKLHEHVPASMASGDLTGAELCEQEPGETFVSPCVCMSLPLVSQIH